MEKEPNSRPAESQLLNDRQYRLLVNSITDLAIYMLDPDGFVVSWNPGAERLKGYNPLEILGCDFSLFYTAEERSSGEPQRALQIAASAGRFSSEGWRVRQNGSRFWASVIIDPVYEGAKLIGFAKVTRDISERKESQLALEMALERLLLATEKRQDRHLGLERPIKRYALG
jgi:PAS domain S-box-containing protein